MQIFLDMAVLVDAQGDMLDNIESQVIELFYRIVDQRSEKTPTLYLTSSIDSS